MTTREMIRCKHCMYLIEGDNGEWLCSDCEYEGDEKDIHEIPDEECSLEQDW